MFAWRESASIDCARLIRGTASSAKLVAPVRAIALMPVAVGQRPEKPDQHRVRAQLRDLLGVRRRDLDDHVGAQRRRRRRPAWRPPPRTPRPGSAPPRRRRARRAPLAPVAREPLDHLRHQRDPSLAVAVSFGTPICMGRGRLSSGACRRRGGRLTRGRPVAEQHRGRESQSPMPSRPIDERRCRTAGRRRRTRGADERQRPALAAPSAPHRSPTPASGCRPARSRRCPSARSATLQVRRAATRPVAVQRAGSTPAATSPCTAHAVDWALESCPGCEGKPPSRFCWRRR